ncbi:dihydrolipoamide acetyltransferase family protein [Arthrobacter sp. TMS1-12-1]
MTTPPRTTRIREFRLPDLGEGLTESEIVQWHVAEGDTVELNQIIADVETAKAVVELPSPYAGVVVRLHEAAGTVVDVGAPIVSFEVADAPGESVPLSPSPAGGQVADEPATDGPPLAEPAPARREPNLVGYGAAVEKGGRPQRRSRVLAATQAPETPPSPAAPPAAAAPAASAQYRERPRSTPPVRKLARDLGIALDTLTGTGAGALITRADVLAALAGAPSAPAAPVAPAAPPEPVPQAVGSAGGETRTPIRGMRKHTAAAMVASAFSAPHATEFLTIDVTPTMDLLAELKASRAFEGTRVTPLTVVAKALCIAIARNPSLNSSWDEGAQEIVQYADVNLGIAAATPRGLLVPNIKAAQALTLMGLAQALGSLTETARAGRTPPADLAGGTISITNIGVFGIDAGTPILNPGEAAILAMGAVRSMPWEYRGEIALRSVMTLSLSFDHRLVDGEQGSRFLADVGTILRNPAMVLTMV